MSLPYYDRLGDPIDFLVYARLMEDRDYYRIDATTVGELWVSTVWLGIDHGMFTAFDVPNRVAPPVIFETMIVNTRTDEWRDEQWRYCTEEQAREGHAAVVAWLRGEGDEP